MEDKSPRKFFQTIWRSPPSIGRPSSGRSYSQPEKELMLAVLKDAMHDYKKCMYSGNALFKEAETWLFDRERDRLFSFETVCAVLGAQCGENSSVTCWPGN